MSSVTDRLAALGIDRGLYNLARFTEDDDYVTYVTSVRRGSTGSATITGTSVLSDIDKLLTMLEDERKRVDLMKQLYDMVTGRA